MNSPPPSIRSSPTGLARFTGAGLELAGFAVVCALLGYGLDRWLGNTRLLSTAFATIIGFSIGLVRFMILASKVNAIKSRTADQPEGD